jgi:hypothetical protein
VKRGFVDVGENNARAFLKQARGCCEADAACGAGNHGANVCEFQRMIFG